MTTIQIIVLHFSLFVKVLHHKTAALRVISAEILCNIQRGATALLGLAEGAILQRHARVQERSAYAFPFFSAIIAYIPTLVKDARRVDPSRPSQKH